MAKLEVRNLTKVFGSVTAVDNVSFIVNDGEWVTLLGPSGCGKTTTLRLIAGFLRPDQGEILVNDRTISTPEQVILPEKRDMGMVFQSYAVWPHMTVFDNVAFGLHLRRIDRAETEERVYRVLDMVKLSGLDKRFPGELSGGQQQRVAVARSLVTETKIILFDEPLSNLDAKLREELRFEFRELQSRLGFTSIYVTHDQAEALVMSDRICIINKGAIEQLEDPLRVYHHPRTKFVAEFVGLTNFIEGRVLSLEGQWAEVQCEDIGADLKVSVVNPSISETGTKATISIRPEAIGILPMDAEPEPGNLLEARVIKVTFLGHILDYRCRVKDVDLRVQELSREALVSRPITAGQQVRLRLSPSECSLIP